MLQEKNLIKGDQFHFNYGKDDENFVLEDRAKRGLPVIDHNVDSDTGFLVEIGRFYDGSGSHSIPIRLHIPKKQYNLDRVSNC